MHVVIGSTQISNDQRTEEYFSWKNFTSRKDCVKQCQQTIRSTTSTNDMNLSCKILTVSTIHAHINAFKSKQSITFRRLTNIE